MRSTQPGEYWLTGVHSSGWMSGMTDTLDPEATTTPIRRPNDNPYLAGNGAGRPKRSRRSTCRPRVEIPAELEGRWLRNGPTPKPSTSTHPSTTGSWASAWSTAFGCAAARPSGIATGSSSSPELERPGCSAPNTNVGGFAGTTWAMVEGGGPPDRARLRTRTRRDRNASTARSTDRSRHTRSTTPRRANCTR